MDVTICQLVANCRKFDGKRVRFRASVISDGFEHTALVGPGCKRGVAPWTSDEADKRPDVEAFNRALEDLRPGTGTGDRQVTATFTGRFTCKPASHSPERRRVINVEAVEELQVKQVMTH